MTLTFILFSETKLESNSVGNYTYIVFVMKKMSTTATNYSSTLATYRNSVIKLVNKRSVAFLCLHSN